MAKSLELEVVFWARDNASQGFRQLQQQAQQTGTAVAGALVPATAQTQLFGRGFLEATRSVQVMGQEVLQRLNPALAGAVSAMSASAGAARGLPVALGVATVGIAGISAALSLYIDKIQEAQKFQAQLGFAAKSGDLGAIRGLMTEAAKGMEEFSVRASMANQPITSIRKELEVITSFWQNFLGKQPTEFMANIDAANAKLKELLPSERRRMAATAEAQLSGTKITGMQPFLQRLVAENDEAAFTRESAFVEELMTRQGLAQRDAIRAQRDTELKTAQARFASPEELALIGRDATLKMTQAEAESGARRFAFQETTRNTLLAIRERNQPPLTPGLEEMARGEGGEVTPEQLVRARKAMADADARGLQTASDRAALEAQMVGLTQSQLSAAQLRAIEAERLLRVQQAGADEERAALANDEARIRSAQVLTAERERLSPAAGFDKLGRELAQQGESLGTAAYNLGRTAASSFQSGMGDFLGDVITGETRKGVDYGKALGNALARGVANEFAAVVTGQIGGTLRNLLRSGGSGGWLGSLLGPPEATPGTAPGAVAGGAVAGSNVVLVGGRYLSASDVAVAQAEAGPQGVRALASGQAVVSGGELIAAGQGFEMAGAGVAANNAVSGSGGGISYSQAAGLAAGVAVYGASLYAAYQSTASNMGVAVNTAMGALQGAALGYQVSGNAYGAAIGAIVAAAGSLYASLAGKAKNDAELLKARKAAEVANAVGAGGDLVRAAQGAGNLQEFYDVLVARGSGYTGGTQAPAVITTVETPQGTRMVGTNSSVYPVAGLQEVFDNLSTLKASIQQGVAPNLLAPANAAAAEALIAQGQRLLDDYNADIGQVEVFAESEANGLSRRTSVPGSRASELRGRDLFVSQTGLAGLDPANRELLIRQLVQEDHDGDLQQFTKDRETEDIRSVTSLIPPPAPGGTGTGPGTGTGTGTPPTPSAPPLPAFTYQPSVAVPSSMPAQQIYHQASGEGQSDWYEPNPAYAQAVAAQTARSADARGQLQTYLATLSGAQFQQAIANPSASMTTAIRNLTLADRQALGVALVEQGLLPENLAAFSPGETGPGAGPGSGNSTGSVSSPNGIGAGGVAGAIGGELDAAITAAINSLTSVGIPGTGIGISVGANGVSAGLPSSTIGATIGNAIGQIAGFFAGFPGAGLALSTVGAALGAAIGQGISNQAVEAAVNAAVAQGVGPGPGLGIGLGDSEGLQAALDAAVAAAVAAVALDSGVTAGGSSTAGLSGPTAQGGPPGSGGPPGDVGQGPNASAPASSDGPGPNAS